MIDAGALNPSNFRAHSLHGDASSWPETNCYIDLWIEMLHAMDLDPVAMLPFCLAADFEGDQWTFVKPSLDDLWSLYRIDVQELNVWNSLVEQIAEQVQRGRIVLVEVDSFYLPDTKGIAYHLDHSKTTIGLTALTSDNSKAYYFHNSGFFAMEGDDLASALRFDPPHGETATMLPPYAELVKLERLARLAPRKLRSVSVEIALRHSERRPRSNPFTAWRERFTSDMETIIAEPEAYYHRYVFSSLRQFGASFQLAAVYLRWLNVDRDAAFEDTATRFDAISSASKTLLFKMARAVANKKILVFEVQVDEMEVSWDAAFSVLPALLEDCREKQY